MAAIFNSADRAGGVEMLEGQNCSTGNSAGTAKYRAAQRIRLDAFRLRVAGDVYDLTGYWKSLAARVWSIQLGRLLFE
jgi:hypothetical protein